MESEAANRGERNTGAYVPTFFTAPQHHAALTAARPQVPAAAQVHQVQPVRAQRETPVAAAAAQQYAAPLYYQQY